MKSKYLVKATAKVYWEYIVEAESAEEARDIVEEQSPTPISRLYENFTTVSAEEKNNET